MPDKIATIKRFQQTRNQRIVRREIVEQDISELEIDLAKCKSLTGFRDLKDRLKRTKEMLEMHKKSIVNLTNILTNLGVVDD